MNSKMIDGPAPPVLLHYGGVRLLAARLLTWGQDSVCVCLWLCPWCKEAFALSDTAGLVCPKDLSKTLNNTMHGSHSAPAVMEVMKEWKRRRRREWTQLEEFEFKVSQKNLVFPPQEVSAEEQEVQEFYVFRPVTIYS